MKISASKAQKQQSIVLVPTFNIAIKSETIFLIYKQKKTPGKNFSLLSQKMTKQWANFLFTKEGQKRSIFEGQLPFQKIQIVPLYGII